MSNTFEIELGRKGGGGVKGQEDKGVCLKLCIILMKCINIQQYTGHN